MTAAVKDIVIAGGGSAGWLVAGVLAADHGERLRISVVESADVPTIGVGEGTWPTLRDTLRRIGISEATLFRECDAAFKQGSRFDGWRDGGGDDRFYHPFMLPHGYLEADLVGAWLAAGATTPFAETMSAQAYLCAHDRAPKQAATPEYAAVANYAYHLDAAKLGKLLREHCTRRLGVRHISDHITAVEAHDNGDIAALRLREHGRLAGDLFVDCTGQRALLLGGHYHVPFIARRDVLFNDRALALQVPYADDRVELASQTISSAQSNGWIWDIGLPTRRGIGHVYSSAHTSDADAERVLAGYVAATGGPTNADGARQLRFEPGYRETFWQRNCVAIGLSAGFIEPLEASAIVMIELSAAWLSEDWPTTRSDMDIVARRFNEAFSYRWERVIEFLKLHYVLSQRRDSDFWRDHARDESIPPRLAELLRLWHHRPPSHRDFARVEEIFPSASWQYILYGMGFKPAAEAPRAAAMDAARAYFAENQRMTRKLLDGLHGNRAVIDHIRQRGLPAI
ncbi:MAG: tryptophan halogenase family protein [Rudaea sp.]